MRKVKNEVPRLNIPTDHVITTLFQSTWEGARTTIATSSVAYATAGPDGREGVILLRGIIMLRRNYNVEEEL